MLRSCAFWILGFLMFIFVSIILFPPMPGGIRYPGNSKSMQTARTLVLAEFSYASDNDGKYPDGRNSVEICQKLIDGKYVSDPSIFYVPMKGKTKAVAGHALGPENVCWDFTVHRDGSGLDMSDPDSIPVLFLTGCRLNYVAGGSATPVDRANPIPTYDDSKWWGTLNSEPPGLAVAYKNNGSKFILLDSTGLVPKVVPDDFEAKDKAYRQVTPDGALP